MVHEETFAGNRFVHDLDCDDGFIWQRESLYTLNKYGLLYVY